MTKITQRNNSYRFHVLGMPNKATSKVANCFISQKIANFCKMMKGRGIDLQGRTHQVIHYGHESSDLICDEHVTVITDKDIENVYGFTSLKKCPLNINDKIHEIYIKNAIEEIAKRKEKFDFILAFPGIGVKPVLDAHNDLIGVEPNISYLSNHFARWKIFESYNLYHAYYGIDSFTKIKQDWYEAVIPHFIDEQDYTYNENKKDYFLVIGPFDNFDSVEIPKQITHTIGADLVLLDAGSFTGPVHPSIKILNNLTFEQRKDVIADAKAAFILPMTNNSFIKSQIECLISGTPIITTDWGSATEINHHGHTGYRCRTFDQILWSAKNIDRINPKNCRLVAENYEIKNVGLMYEEYFESVYNVHAANGWYQIRTPDRGELDWLKRILPTHPEKISYMNIDVEERPFAKNLSNWIKTNLSPDKVLDVGCGPGTYVNEMRAIGINAYGIDIDERTRNKEFLTYKSLFELTEQDKAQTVICLEVAEHIDQQFDDQVIEKLKEVVGHTLIWTAAAADQGGIGHINCKDKNVWASKFESAGFYRNMEKEKKLIHDITQGFYMGWFPKNVLYLEKVS